jgi:environmental stress-induced protein Ves
VSAELVTWRALVPQAWKNGAGTTREIAAEPPGAGLDGFAWRISVAELVQDGPFSAFPGIDRCITLLRGAGMTLRSGDGSVDRRIDRVGEPFFFAGEKPVEARLIGGDCEELNVMVRRGRHRAEVEALDARRSAGPALAGLLACLGGRWRCTGHDAVLDTGQALLWHHGLPALDIDPAAPGLAILVRIA